MYIVQRQAAVAQSVEQRTENPCVNSSSLFGGKTTFFVNVVFFCSFAFNFTITEKTLVCVFMLEYTVLHELDDTN